MSFSDIPVRTNGPSILASWFNLLRTAGISLSAIVGNGTTEETYESMSNPTSSMTAVTGLSLDLTIANRWVVDFFVSREGSNEDSPYVHESHARVIAQYSEEDDDWFYEVEQTGKDDGSGGFTTLMEFQVDKESGGSDGEIKYTADEITNDASLDHRLYWKISSTVTGRV